MVSPRPLWHDRRTAGLALACRLKDLEGCAAGATLVALPRGGVPVAAAMAERLHLPLVTWAVRKIALPWAPEVAVGAIAPGGVTLRADDQPDDRRSEASTALRQDMEREERQELERRRRCFGDPPAAALTGRRLIVVDDGIATGMTTRAALRSLRLTQPASLILAVPVVDRRLLDTLGGLVERLEVLQAVPDLRAVGQWYERFEPLEDGEVLRLLEQARRWAALPTGGDQGEGSARQVPST
ncbi:MAG: hypothetical protein ER33_08215 [Cyanobium sp. CACIAM 14]|nr:MAG: hypothetical protein ER33_08215 [Cyanobium sp. CACIAM 14]